MSERSQKRRSGEAKCTLHRPKQTINSNGKWNILNEAQLERNGQQEKRQKRKKICSAHTST